MNTIDTSIGEFVMNSEKSGLGPKVIRHYRNLVDDGSYRGLGDDYRLTISNLGGITIVAQIDYIHNTIKYGWAICSVKDNFNKELGVKVANDRFENFPVVISYNPNKSIKQNLSHAVYRNMANLDPRIKPLKILVDGDLYLV